MNLIACMQLLATAVVTASPASAPWISRADYNRVSVALAETASPSEHYAAEQFQRYWEQCTGFRPPVGAVAGPGITVWIGRDGLPQDLLAEVNLEGLEPDGLHLRTSGKNLIIAGGRQRGTMYAVFEFFERYMGVRWLAPDFTHVPPAPESLAPIDFRYVPPFALRETNYRPFSNPEFAVAHRLNGSFSPVPPERGGTIGYANGFAHTFHSFVSPDEYGGDHPEYFSLVNGERRTEKSSTQLCLTNPDVLRIVIEKTREILRRSPSDRPYVCITQMDTGFWCECPECAAIDKENDSHSGSVIWFVNQVAAAIADEFPAAYIDTFAYTYTRKPPKNIRPRDNVLVRLCSIECNFSRPHSDPKDPHNGEFHDDIDQWSKIAKNLFIWDYTQNWYCHQQPHPNFHVLQPNIQFFAEHGVKGLFEQASPTSPHSDFEYLKAYLLAKAMWNPKVDWRECMDEFIRIYYGPAGPYVQQYIDLITNKILGQDFYLSFNCRLDWMDYDTQIQAEALFQKAFAATQDPVITERLRSIYLPVQYAALMCPPKIQREENAWILTRPPSLTADAYWDQIMKMGVTMLEDLPIDKLHDRLKAQILPRSQRLAIEKIANDRYEVWVIPEICGAVVQFRDKQSGLDLFRGEEAVLKEHWRWQDWEVMDPKAPRIEEAISGPYALAARTPDSITVEKNLDNGLSIRRCMTLKPGGSPLEVEFTVINRGAAPIRPGVKPHPEFWLQGLNTPEIWLERPSGWEKLPLKYGGSEQMGGDSINPSGLTRWAARIPAKDLTVISTVPQEKIEKLFYYFNIANEHVNLEIVPDQTPLEPGASRSLKTSFTIARKEPGR